MVTDPWCRDNSRLAIRRSSEYSAANSGSAAALSPCSAAFSSDNTSGSKKPPNRPDPFLQGRFGGGRGSDRLSGPGQCGSGTPAALNLLGFRSQADGPALRATFGPSSFLARSRRKCRTCGESAPPRHTRYYKSKIVGERTSLRLIGCMEPPRRLESSFRQSLRL